MALAAMYSGLNADIKEFSSKALENRGNVYKNKANAYTFYNNNSDILFVWAEIWIPLSESF